MPRPEMRNTESGNRGEAVPRPYGSGLCAAGGFETRPYNRKTACHQSAFLGRVSGISLQTSATPAAANAARARNAAGLPK